MAHEVETMAYAHETPWHGLGTQVPANVGVDGILEAAGLDWTVSKRPVYWAPEELADDEADSINSGQRVPGQYALVRDTDNRVLTSIGRNWRPVQNRQAFEMFDAFVTAGGATMETAGSLRNGELVWGLANLNAGFKVSDKAGDEIRGYLLLVNPHQCGRAIMARVTPIRVVCANTMAMALSGEAKFEARFSHTKEFDPAAAIEVLGIARDQISDFAKTMKQLRSIAMSREEAIRFLAPIYAEKVNPDLLVETDGGASRTLKSIMGAYEEAPGAEPGNAWGVLNAVTYHTDHLANTNRDARLTTSWVGWEANRRQRVIDELLALA